MKEEWLKRSCIFCGEDSPSTGGREIIEWCSEHIKKCEHHPMRELERKLSIAEDALQQIFTPGILASDCYEVSKEALKKIYGWKEE